MDWKKFVKEHWDNVKNISENCLIMVDNCTLQGGEKADVKITKIGNGYSIDTITKAGKLYDFYWCDTIKEFLGY